MKRVLCGALALGLLMAFTVMAPSAEKDNPSVKQIMTKAHKMGDGLLDKLKSGLKADEPKWDDVQKQTKELADLGTALGKNDPPKGTKESWTKLTKEYADNAKALDEAAQKKDKAVAGDDLKKLQTSCMDCHRAHKPFKPKP